MSGSSSASKPSIGASSKSSTLRRARLAAATAEAERKEKLTPPKVLRKRVYVLSFFISSILGTSVWKGGTAGLFTFLKACAALCLLWFLIWHLYVRKVGFMRNLITSLFNPYSEESKTLAPRKRVTLDYGDDDEGGEDDATPPSAATSASSNAATAHVAATDEAATLERRSD